MKIFILLALVGAAAAHHLDDDPRTECDIADPEVTVRRGTGRSGTADDAEARASCPNEDYEMVRCECASFPDRDDCDGSYFETNVDGTFCVARNKHGGKGVEAVATCEKIMITCSTKYCSDPSTYCPRDKGYKLTACIFHSDERHNHMETRLRYHSPHGGDCSTLPNVAKSGRGCNYDRCRVQARCVKVTGYAKRQIVPSF